MAYCKELTEYCSYCGGHLGPMITLGERLKHARGDCVRNSTHEKQQKQRKAQLRFPGV
ncbi:MAG: hypothetical protein UV21_C0002G0096 [candidate division WWE3 bacterium GW2011_GWD2_42_34]|nr:MAG: hypothetical protein UV21_C0002G0096 [candidate division WWE3 bacterium GW2011_GWD2_42_34]KKT09017.1 MAG: hypothetical protein UV87_C0001G0062 [candidate division WWE3 bacterium GW2011_GWD1_43_201]